MTDPVEVVRQFLSTLSEGREGLDEAPRRWFTDTTVWENVGVSTVTGIDEAIALNAKLEQTSGVSALRVETLAIAASGGKVLTERADDMFDAHGAKINSMRVMGIFEVDRDGKIACWRDYFDTAAMKQGG